MQTPIRIPAQLGAILRSARQQQGLTLADVGRRLGVSTQAVSKLELNVERASFERVHRLCLALGLELVLQPRPTADASSPMEW